MVEPVTAALLTIGLAALLAVGWLFVRLHQRWPVLTVCGSVAACAVSGSKAALAGYAVAYLTVWYVYWTMWRVQHRGWVE